MHLSEKEISDFQEKILTWYANQQRDFPWRKTRDPYKILISEVMSQQTQITRVVPKYEAWLQAFPTVFDLATASTTEVLTHWSGLGYNRRALYLQKAAQKIVNDFNGVFPDDQKVLQTLPGIGEYTANAIACFAFNKQIAVIDTNVRKVVLTQILDRYSSFPPHLDPLPRGEEKTHFFSLRERPGPPDGGAGVRGKTLKDALAPSVFPAQIDSKTIQHIAEQLLPIGRAYEWNQALMDYAGAMLKQEKIAIPKQSRFKDSDRFYRGQIIKLLIEKKAINTMELHDNFNSKEQTITQERLKKIIAKLEKDNLIKELNGALRLP